MEREAKRQKVREGSSLLNPNVGKEFRRLCLAPQLPEKREENEIDLLDLAAQILPLQITGFNAKKRIPFQVDDLAQKRAWVSQVYGPDFCDDISRYGAEEGNEYLLTEAVRENVPKDIWYTILQTAARKSYADAVRLAAARKDLQPILRKVINEENRRREADIEAVVTSQLRDALYIADIFPASYERIDVGPSGFCFEKVEGSANDEWEFIPRTKLLESPKRLEYWIDFIQDTMNNLLRRTKTPRAVILEPDEKTGRVRLDKEVLFRVLIDILLAYRNITPSVGPIDVDMSKVEERDRPRIWSTLLSLNLVSEDYDENAFQGEGDITLKSTNQLVRELGLPSPQYPPSKRVD